MAKFNPPGSGRTLKEVGRENVATRKRVAASNARKRSNFGGGVDEVGRRMALHHTDARAALGRRGGWGLDIGKPARFWERRFRLRPEGPAFYDEVEDAWVRIDKDGAIDRLMKGRAMSVMIRVKDAERGQLWVTAAVAGAWDRALGDIQMKLLEWSQRYGPADDDDEDASRIREVVVLVGARK